MALQQHPVLASTITNCIGLWAETEIQLANLLTVILRLEVGSAFAAVQMYLRLNGAEARRSVLDAAANAMLSPNDHALFSLTMKAIKAVRTRRNDFVHGLWGISSELTDALLWIGADDHIAYEAVLSGAYPAHAPTAAAATVIGAAIHASDTHRDAIMVYRAPDLADDMTRANQALQAVTLLRGALHPYEKQAGATRQQLQNLPLLQTISQPQNTPGPPTAQP